jgi:hypothetical protein
MNLSELIRRLSSETGLPAATDAQIQVLVDLINDAGEQLWDQTDLPNALLEEVFTIDTTDPVPRLSLPSRVGELRGCRDWNSKITLHDMRPRYNNYPWPQDQLYTFRVLRESPIARSIDNAIGLYMPPIVGFAGPLSVDIVGSTNTAAEFHASFDLNGEGTAVGVLWTDIRAITKSEYTPVDVVLHAGDDNTGAEMCRLGTNEYRAAYKVVELYELPFINTSADRTSIRPIEVLYKSPFLPLVQDTSSFQLGGYDHVLIANAIKLFRIRGIGADASENQIKAAQVHAIRADEILARKIATKNQAVKHVLQFGRPRGDIRNLRGLRKYRYGHD